MSSSRLATSGRCVRVVGDHPVGVGLGALDLLRRLVGGHPQLDDVALGLAHLGAVGAQDEGGLGQQGAGLGEGLAVAVVEAAGDHPRLLEVRELVAAHRHDVGLAEQDVRGLVDRVGQQQPADRGDAGGGRLVLDRGVALQLGDAHQAQERQHQLVERRDGRVREDRRPLGVEAGGDVVDDQAAHVAGDVAEGLAVGDHLVVGDELPDLRAALLEPDPVADRREVVPDVQGAGRSVPGQHAQRAGVGVEELVELGAAGEGCLVGLGHRASL